MDHFRYVCGQSKWKRRRTEDLQKVCADALSDAHLNRVEDSLRFLRCRYESGRSPSEFHRWRTSMVLALSTAVLTPRHACKVNSAIKRRRLSPPLHTPSSKTVTKDQFISYVEQSLPSWQHSYTNAKGSKKKDIYSVCAKTLSGQRFGAARTVHIFCPHSKTRDYLPYCVHKLWGAKMQTICYDIVVPDIVLYDRLDQWSRASTKRIRVADATDKHRLNPPAGVNACSRIWTVSNFAAILTPEIALYSVVVVDDLEWWPSSAKLVLARVRTRAIVVGCSMQIWRQRRAFVRIAPYLDIDANHSLYVCSSAHRVCKESSLVDHNVRLMESAVSKPLVITLQVAHAYVMWLAILSEQLMEYTLSVDVGHARIAWRSFAVACNATSQALAEHNLPPEILNPIWELRRWTIRACLAEWSSSQNSTTVRYARQRIMSVTESVELNLSHICPECLAPLGLDNLTRREHICDWNCRGPVHIPEVEDSGALTVSEFFIRYAIRMSAIHRMRVFIREGHRKTALGTGIVRYDNTQIGEELLRSWYSALVTENLHHLLDANRIEAAARDASSTIRRGAGAVLTIMGTQNYKEWCCGKYHQVWKQVTLPGTSWRSAVPADICRDNKTVRLLTAQIAPTIQLARSAKGGGSPPLTQAALSCVLLKLPDLLGTDCHLLSNSTTMFQRWNFYSDVQLVHLLPSYFLARNACRRLRLLVNRGLFSPLRWSAPEGSPAHLALQLMLPA
uniref:Uncharacterized protein n=1 Tax=viral metagenome TaxID=1070528 RepID=A0A6C0C342_9ZZZZ